MAARLGAAVQHIPGLTVVQPVQTNVVFATLPADVAIRLQKRFSFYVWDERTDLVRWMTSFDTRVEDVDAFALAIAEEMAAG